MAQKFLLIGLFLLSALVGAQETQESPSQAEPEQEEIDKSFWLEEEPGERPKPIDVQKLFFKTVVLVIFISGAVLAGGWLLKKVTGSKFNTFNTEGAIQILERKYLSPKTSVWLLKVNEKAVVVIESVHGVGIHTIS
jgi:flagellar protein FliO/FliZ